MNEHEMMNWLAAGVIAAVMALSSMLDGPNELQATQDVAAEVAARLTGGAAR